MEAAPADMYLNYRLGDRVVGKNQIENTRSGIDLTVAATNEPAPLCWCSFLGWPHGAIKNGAAFFVPRDPKVPYGSSAPSLVLFSF